MVVTEVSLVSVPHDRGPVPDLVELELPVGRAYASVGRLVAAGVAMRRDVSAERVEDLQTALDTVLQWTIAGERIHLALWITSDGLHVEAGPFPSDVDWRGIDGVLSELVDELVIRASGGDVWVLLRFRELM